MILRVLKKIESEGSNSIVVVPYWEAQAQPWFPLFLSLDAEFIIFRIITWYALPTGSHILCGIVLHWWPANWLRRRTIREALIRKEIPLESRNILLASLLDLLLRHQYDFDRKKWWAFAQTRKLIQLSVPWTTFLMEEFQKSASLISLNCYRSAIFLILRPELGRNEKILHFFRGVARLRPAILRFDLGPSDCFKLFVELISKWRN